MAWSCSVLRARERARSWRTTQAQTNWSGWLNRVAALRVESGATTQAGRAGRGDDGRLRRAFIEAWRDGWRRSRVWWITTSIDEAREIMEGMPAVRLIVIDASLDDLAQRIERRSWLTDEQRADVLALARNMTATLAVTAFAYGDRASRVQTSGAVAGVWGYNVLQGLVGYNT
jgi:hypothetical protein